MVAHDQDLLFFHTLCPDVLTCLAQGQLVAEFFADKIKPSWTYWVFALQAPIAVQRLFIAHRLTDNSQTPLLNVAYRECVGSWRICFCCSPKHQPNRGARRMTLRHPNQVRIGRGLELALLDFLNAINETSTRGAIERA